MKNTIDSKKLRKVAGAFATGITVVTLEKEDGTMHGMTANSFLSVSLNPPLVAFSVREEGTMAKYVKQGKAVGISILSEYQEAISNQFAGRNNPPVEVEMEVLESGVHIVKDCIAWYHTEIKDIVSAGDHYLVICEVLDLDRVEDKKPLVYYSGYQTIA